MSIYMTESSKRISPWLILMSQSLIFIALIGIIPLLGLDTILLGFSLLGNGLIFFVVEFFLIFFLYKNMVTYSLVERVIIDDSKEEIIIVFWLIYFIKKKIVIKYEELSFRAQIDGMLWGYSLSLRIFKNDNYRIKINAKNGWTEDQIKNIYNRFLSITKGRTRTRPWYALGHSFPEDI